MSAELTRDQKRINWQPIETAPRDRKIMLWANGAEYSGRWDDDRHSSKPRPYWTYNAAWLGISGIRANQPVAWRELSAGPEWITKL